MHELDDPPNGRFELRPPGDLAAWRAAHGPDVEIPGSGMTERTAVSAVRAGLELLAALPEATILIVAHGWFVAWLVASAGMVALPGHAVPIALSAAEVRVALEATAADVYARYSP
jgi:hypothetical protein